MSKRRCASALSVLTLAAVTFWAPACATAGTQKTSNNEVLTRSEIAEAGQMNALNLVRLKRPMWLHVRGHDSLSQYGNPTIIVYRDDVRIGTTAALADIDTDDIESMRFYDARQAQVHFGSGHMYGVIAVTSRHGN